MVKASRLIKRLEKGDLVAKVTDVGDSLPCYKFIIVIDENHVCSIKGHSYFKEETLRNSLDEGLCEIKILGVTFTKTFMTSFGDVEVTGEIDYNQSLDESDVLEAAEEYITWPCAEDGNYEEPPITDDDIIYELENDFEIFAVNKNNKICAFEEKDDMPSEGYKIIDTEEAITRLAKERPGFEID